MIYPFHFRKSLALPPILLTSIFIISLSSINCTDTPPTPHEPSLQNSVDSPFPNELNEYIINKFQTEPESIARIVVLFDCHKDTNIRKTKVNFDTQTKNLNMNPQALVVAEIRLANTTISCQDQLLNAFKHYHVLYSLSKKVREADENIFFLINVKENFEKEKLQRSNFGSGNNVFDPSKIQVLRQGIDSSDVLVVVSILAVLALIGLGVITYLKKKKKKANKKELKVEKQKFIPRLQMSSTAPFNGQKNVATSEDLQKKGSSRKNKHLEVPKMMSPHARAGALKLEDNHHSSIINDNIFTNLDNSPRSLEDDTDVQSVKNTPKDIGFNIEFSILDHDNSKIKSDR